MDNSEIRLLRAFPVLMRERSVSRAAEVLDLSQPAMSHVLARLRTLLGDPLLLRSKSGMVPTERALGMSLAVQTLIDDYDRLTRPPEPFNPGFSRRTFNLSAPEFAERMVVPALLRGVRKEAPNIRVIVHAPASSGERAFDLMERGELDVRIAWLIPAPVASLRSVRLFTDRLVCVADRRHPSIRGTIALDDFFSLPHVRTVGYSHTTTGRAIDDAIARQGRSILPAQIVQTFLTMLNAIPGTDLIAIVPRLLAEDFAGRRQLQVVEPPLPPVRYAAYWHERNQRDAGHRWLRGMLVDAAGSVR
jgi:DNA-binding transcriptional LysR family regulator